MSFNALFDWRPSFMLWEYIVNVCCTVWVSWREAGEMRRKKDRGGGEI